MESTNWKGASAFICGPTGFDFYGGFQTGIIIFQVRGQQEEKLEVDISQFLDKEKQTKGYFS